MAYPKRLNGQDVAGFYPANDNRLDHMAWRFTMTATELAMVVALHVLIIAYIVAVLPLLFD